jgi:hypothetical protein
MKVVDILGDDTMKATHELKFTHAFVGQVGFGTTDNLAHFPEHFPYFLGVGPEGVNGGIFSRVKL